MVESSSGFLNETSCDHGDDKDDENAIPAHAYVIAIHLSIYISFFFVALQLSYIRVFESDLVTVHTVYLRPPRRATHALHTRPPRRVSAKRPQHVLILLPDTTSIAQLPTSMFQSPPDPEEETLESTFAREAKRRRVSTPSDHRTLSQTRQGSSYWFEDGDIILEVENHRFKIHKERLKCSDIFAGMLDIPQPQDFENIDGCPLVSLSDSAQDWHAALQWIYERE